MRLAAEATLEDIYSATDEWRLPVEPLGMRIPISRFLVEGGYGYGSLQEGSLAGKILNLTWKKEGKTYHYGLDDSTLYNAGYPLQRIIDMGRSNALNMDLGTIESVTVLAVESSTPNVYYKEEKIDNIDMPPDANDLVFLNERAASLFGLPREGILVAASASASEGKKAEDAWSKRFIEDTVPGGLKTLRVLALKSNLPDLLSTAQEESYVLVLATLKGYLVNIYCSQQVESALREKVESLEHCYLL